MTDTEEGVKQRSARLLREGRERDKKRGARKGGALPKRERNHSNRKLQALAHAKTLKHLRGELREEGHQRNALTSAVSRGEKPPPNLTLRDEREPRETTTVPLDGEGSLRE